MTESDKINEVDDLLMDVLYQACGYLPSLNENARIDNEWTIAYENACVYLEKQGYLKKRNNRVYEVLKR